MDISSSVAPVTYTLASDLLFLSKLFAHTSDAVCAVDANQRILYWNRAAENMLGYAAAEVIGRPCYQALQGQTPDSAVFCRQECSLFQEAKAAAACPCHLVSLKDKTDSRHLFCMSTLAVAKECRQDRIPILIHLWRPLTRPCRSSVFNSPANASEKCRRLIQTLRLELETLLAAEQVDAPYLTPV